MAEVVARDVDSNFARSTCACLQSYPRSRAWTPRRRIGSFRWGCRDAKILYSP